VVFDTWKLKGMATFSVWKVVALRALAVTIAGTSQRRMTILIR
jgi:hypothetical protein